MKGVYDAAGCPTDWAFSPSMKSCLVPGTGSVIVAAAMIRMPRVLSNLQTHSAFIVVMLIPLDMLGSLLWKREKKLIKAK